MWAGRSNRKGNYMKAENITLHVFYNRQEALNALNDLMQYFPTANYILNPLYVGLGEYGCMFMTMDDIEEHKINGVEFVAFVLHDRVKQVMDSSSVAYIKSRLAKRDV